MSKLTRKVVILAKLEATYATDPTPTGADDAILVNAGIDLRPTGERIERTIVRDTFSPAGNVIGAKVVALDIEVEAKGGGWDTDDPLPPEYDVLLQCCAMSVDVSITGQRTYLPVTDPADHESCTIYCYRDGILHIVTGCMGTFSLNLPVGGIPTLKFSMQGLWVDPTDTPIPGTVTTLDLVPPVVKGIGLTVGGYTPVGVNALSIDIGNQIIQRKDVNAAEGLTGLAITGRNPTGSLDPEVDTLSNFGVWAAWKAATKSAIACTVGSVAGNRFDLAVAKAQYDDVSYGDRDGTLIYALPFTATINSDGDDEVSLTFR